MKTRPLAILSALAIANSLCAPVIAEEALGRLFFTPERRHALDHQREFNIQEKVETQQEPTFTINGVVTRSSGKQTVWVNGKVVGENNAASDVDIVPMRQNPGQVVIQSGDATTTSAKVGETVQSDTGETADLLNGGRIVVRKTGQSRRQ